jgi:hypothetical protein
MQTLLRRRWAMSVYSLFVACLLLVVTSPVPTAADSESCARMREWASTYVATRAALTLDDIAPLTRAERVAVFNAIAPEVRADLWREQLHRFAARADVTAAQRAFILAERERLNADAYRPAGDRAARRAKSQAFWASASPLFPSQEHRRIWFDIGAVVNTPRAQITATAAPRLISAPTALAQDPLCECSGVWSHIECAPGGYCDGDWCQSHGGCGPEGMDWCTGMCFWDRSTNADEP